MKVLIMIYRITFLVVVCLAFCLLINHFEVLANNLDSSSVIEENSQNIYEFDQNINNILEKEDYQVMVGNDTSYLVKGQIIYQVNGIVTDFQIYDNQFYFLLDNSLVVSDLTDELVLKLPKDIKYLSLSVQNELIYLCGNKNNDAYLEIYSLTFEMVNSYQLGGDGFEQFIEVYPFQDGYYLIGEKDSTSFNSPFKNVGGVGTRKVFMVYLEEEKIINEVYFDGGKQNEFYNQSIFQDDSIYILVSSNIVYRLDLNLKILPMIEYNGQIFQIISNYQEEILYFDVENNNELYLNHQKFYVTSGKIANIIIRNGECIIFTIKNQIVKEISLSEYHILKNDSLICNKYYYDLTTLANLKVESYFERLEKKIISYDPFFQKQLDGEYKIKYQITRENGNTFLLDGNLIVQPFVNIIDNGIYPVNKELYFFGNAKLNEVEIFNGYKIIKPGNYHLELTNANGITCSYNFLVLENYYKSDDTVTFDSDYLVYPNEELIIQVKLDLQENQIINKVFVNGLDYDDFQVDGSVLSIKITGKGFYSIDSYTIDKIVYYDQGYHELLVGKNFTVKTIKKLPKIDVSQSVDEQLIKLDYNIQDLQQSIIAMKIVIYDDNNLVGTFYHYLNQEPNITILNKVKKPIIKHFLTFYDGNSYREQLLCEYQSNEININKFEQISTTINLNLENIEIKLDPIKGKFKHLIINNQDLIESINIGKSIVNPFKITVFCGILIFITVIYYFLKQKKLVKKTK